MTETIIVATEYIIIKDFIGSMIINKEKWNKFKNKVDNYLMRKAIEDLGCCNCFRCKKPLSKEDVEELLKELEK